MAETLPVSADGYTDLPPGKIANVVTYLEMTEKPEGRPTGSREDLALARLRGTEVDRYLRLYRTLGERWLWWSRLQMTRADVAALLDREDVEAYALVATGEDAGLLELDFRLAGEVELAFFGIFEAQIGRGLGSWLIDRAIEKAWRRSPHRFFVHTCTFDHPGAVDFYRKSGFAPYKYAIEIADDPRLGGTLPPTAGPHVPLLRPRRSP